MLRIESRNKKQIMQEMETLQFCKIDGFYDSQLDMFFNHLEDWLSFKWNVKFSEII